jgi:HK97 family phage major capsid protein
MGAQVPVDAARQRLWGIPVVVSTAIAVGTGLLCDFAGSTVAVEREGVRIDWSEAVEGSVAGHTAYETNELVFRGEGRFDFAVTRPRGVCTMTTLPS